MSPVGGPFWVTIVGNFDVVNQTLPAYFQHTGIWYDYLSGQSVNVTNASMTFNLQPGEFHIYTNQQLPTPPEGFTPWSNAAIPVELMSFNGKVQNKTDAALNWQTASERGNAFFDIERSFDGTKFEKIGQIKGNGTSNTPHFYNFIDRNVANGFVYYRLRQTDFDGKEVLSNVVT